MSTSSPTILDVDMSEDQREELEVIDLLSEHSDSEAERENNRKEEAMDIAEENRPDAMDVDTEEVSLLPNTGQ